MASEIPLFHPEITQDDVSSAAQRVNKTHKYTRGLIVPEFEKALSDTTGVEHTVATSNGTTALHLGVRAMNWHGNDQIITSPLSFIATSNVLVQEKLPLVFGPINDQLQLDMPKVYDLIADNPSTQGVVVPYIYGHEADSEALSAIKRDFPDVRIIEDAAQAFAEKERGLAIGEHSDAVVYSFHENKVITTLGEGGTLQLHQADVAHLAHAAREQGRLNTPDWLNQIKLGFNYRMTEIQAAAGLLQLGRLGLILDRRQQIADFYIDTIEERGLPLETPSRSTRSWFGFYAIARAASDAESMQHELSDLGIGARQTPMPAIYNFAHIRATQPVIKDEGTAEVATRILNIPLHSALSDSDVERVMDSLELVSRRRSMSATPLSSDRFYSELSESYSVTRAERQKYLDSVDAIVIEELSRIQGDRIIDIGCGDGVRGVKIASRSNKRVTSIDASQGMVDQATKINPDSHREDISSKEFDATHYQSDAALLLWNVLGHIKSEERATALKNVAELLHDDGVLILDVNNQFNAAQYGEENARRNRQAVLTGMPEHTGDFTTTHQVGERKVKTVSHIFHTEEIVSLLEDAGFESHVRYIDYNTGEAATEDTGQIVIIAKKVKLS
ncbi:MAG: DegT/DnrJ/EryC1/StrS family aminotransferase [Candidatus Saccharimonas sp.]